MKRKTRVLILEAGGPCGVSCIKLLKQHDAVTTIAADMSMYSAGLQLANIGLIVPSSGDKNFGISIKRIIDEYSIDLIIPCYEHGYRQLKDIKGPFVMDFESALLCKDKYAFMDFCAKNKLPAPRTELLGSSNPRLDYPLFIKPRSGVGSRDNYIVHSDQDLERIKSFLNNSEDFIIQEYLQGEHWNVDVLVDEGRFITAVARKDLVQKSGNCISVEIRDYTLLSDFAKYVSDTMNIKSPFNLEVFEKEKGQFVINEINLRFGGGIIFSAMAGIDMVSYLVDKDSSRFRKIKEGVYSRYYEETFVEYKDFINLNDK